MLKVGNKLLLIVLLIVLVMTALIMFGCGESITSAQLFDKIDAFIEEIDDSSGIFDSNNRFKNFYKYNDEGKLEEIDSNYQTMVKIAIDFIEVYHYNYRDVKESYNYSEIVEDLTSLNAQYDNCLKSYNNFVKNKDTDSTLIYNGFSLNYQSSCISFIKKAYDLAFSMKESLVNDLKIMEIDFNNITQDQANTYLDFVRLDVANDCKQVLLDDLKGDKFEGNLIWESCGDILNNVYNVNNIVLTYQKGEQFVNLNNIEKKLSQERENVKKAMSNFSIYSYITSGFYGDINGYETIVTDATRWYSKIESYFVNNGEELGCLDNFINQLVLLYE